jgi:hypothetical protein
VTPLFLGVHGDGSLGLFYSIHDHKNRPQRTSNHIIYKSTDKGNEFLFEGTEDQLVAAIKQVIEVKEKN